MKILSIEPLPETEGFIELYNEDGTLSGYCFEPASAYRDCVQAWLLTNLIPIANHALEITAPRDITVEFTSLGAPAQDVRSVAEQFLKKKNPDFTQSMQAWAF
jgi:hypothetical protein